MGRIAFPQVLSRGLISARDLKLPPTRHMSCHQRFEQTSVVWHSKMKELVRDNEVLEAVSFARKIGRQSDCSCC